MTTYTHDTELRHLQPKDLYELSIILEDNDGWIKLLESIPKGLNNQNLSSDSISNTLNEYGPKYNNDHIRIILDACKAPGQIKSQLFLEEWAISGQKYERPTLRVLLLMLIKVELYRAADFVSVNLLKELPPTRPNKGLAAPINTTLPSEIFGDIEEMLNNDYISYPSTAALQQKLSDALDNNKDYFVKYHELIEKQVSATNENCPPKPPPRRNVKLIKQLHQQEQNHHLSKEQSSVIMTPIADNQVDLQFNENTEIIRIMHKTSNLNQTSSCITDNSLPNLSILNKGNEKLMMGSEKCSARNELELNDANTHKCSENVQNELETVDKDCVPRLSILLNSCAILTNGHCNNDDDVDMKHSKKIPMENVTEKGRSVQKVNTLLESNTQIESNHANKNEMPNLNCLLSGLQNSPKYTPYQLHQNAKSLSNFVDVNGVYTVDNPESVASNNSLLKNNKMVKDEITTVETLNVIEIDNLESTNNNDGYNDKDEVEIVDIDDEDDNSMPNLSIFDPNSSTYDSSLTNVTGTSGDLSLASSVTSLDNVPDLNELKH